MRIQAGDQVRHGHGVCAADCASVNSVLNIPLMSQITRYNHSSPRGRLKTAELMSGTRAASVVYI